MQEINHYRVVFGGETSSENWSECFPFAGDLADAMDYFKSPLFRENSLVQFGSEVGAVVAIFPIAN